ncbi:hypothetical protein Syun_014440 [Stephania yunnanensis]|uniref:Uncharacterized protein n=1 Tax=Stephania yunnanensis TaxID=152371 RepID=A0AAP0JK55_9MAGN
MVSRIEESFLRRSTKILSSLKKISEMTATVDPLGTFVYCKVNSQSTTQMNSSDLDSRVPKAKHDIMRAFDAANSFASPTNTYAKVIAWLFSPTWYALIGRNTRPLFDSQIRTHTSGIKPVLHPINITKSANKDQYKDDSTIMALELINEPRCQADYSGRPVNVRIELTRYEWRLFDV